MTGTAGNVALQASGGSHAALEGLAAIAVVMDLSGASVANLDVSGEVLGQVSGELQATITGNAEILVVPSGGGVVSRG